MLLPNLSTHLCWGVVGEAPGADDDVSHLVRVSLSRSRAKTGSEAEAMVTADNCQLLTTAREVSDRRSGESESDSQANV